MDRDNRWERVARAYEAIVHAKGAEAASAPEAVAAAYARGETDEFIAPTVIAGYPGARDGDGVFCLNFRADRAREILSALGAPGFSEFDTGARPRWAAMLGMVDYSDRPRRLHDHRLPQAGHPQHAWRMGRRPWPHPVPRWPRPRNIPMSPSS